MIQSHFSPRMPARGSFPFGYKTAEDSGLLLLLHKDQRFTADWLQIEEAVKGFAFGVVKAEEDTFD
jgi:hypothetical protein